MGPGHEERQRRCFLVSRQRHHRSSAKRSASPATDTCQLLEVEPDFPVTFVYGPNDVRYTINVLKIEPVVIGHT